MRFGKLLLRGLRRNSRRKRQQFKRTARGKKRGQPAAGSRSGNRSVAVSVSESVQSAPAGIAGRDESAALTTREMVMPGDQLRQSIEAFLLDQRSEHTRRAYGKDLKRFLKFLVARGGEKG